MAAADLSGDAVHSVSQDVCRLGDEMPINSDKPNLWKADVEKSIDFYNDWFIRFAPATYREQRRLTTESVLDAFSKTANLTRITPPVLHDYPGLLPILRMVTAPPLARDRLMGLAYLSKSFVTALEGSAGNAPRLPKRMNEDAVSANLQKICDVLSELIDTDLITWLSAVSKPSKQDLARAATVIADRMCGAFSDPIIRNAQEKRQLTTLGRWLRINGYREISTKQAKNPYEMPPGTFTFRLSLPADDAKAPVNIPIDCVVKPLGAKLGNMPVLIEAKSAGDATNTNKRRKEEAQKLHQLRKRYGDQVTFVLYLCGYFEPGYLGYEAAEGIDWVWEHRTSDFASLFLPAGKKKAQAVKEAALTYGGLWSEHHEDNRADAQLLADENKSAEERNRLGQFSTPFTVACHMVIGALEALSKDVPISFLEPALGSGVFFSALLRHAPKKRIAEAVGCEIDAAYGNIAKALWSTSGLSVLECDFIAFVADHRNYKRFSLLCTNPPYVRHQHLQFEQKINLQNLVMQRLGLHVSGLAGLYVYFVLLADSVLTDDAVATWLLPAEFLYVNYGRVLRDYLTSRVTLISLHHFNPDDVQFDDALVSSCIITYRKTRPTLSSSCVVSYGDYKEPQERRVMKAVDLHEMNKWTASHFEKDNSFKDVLRIKDLFSVRRGIATGANDFFIIDEGTIKKYQIPNIFLKPILPSPRYLRETVVRTGIDGLPIIDGARYLLDCRLPPAEVERQYPGVWNYFKAGIEKGVNNGYICAQKDVWYYQERRTPAPFLASYMGRATGVRLSPIRFFVNFSEAIVTNVFLNLYPVPDLAACLVSDHDKMMELGDALNAIPAECIFHAGRAYGGGLHKIEPKELLEVEFLSPPSWVDQTLTRQLVLI